MRSTLKSSLKVSLVSLILIFSLTAVSRAHRHSSYFREDGKQVDNPNWMSVLPDSVRLSELSIPGTHETLSRHSAPFVPLDLVKTQSMALRFQLQSGIRALDVRCAIVGNFFNIYHGNIYQRENFGGVLDTVVAFLKAHPKETILMRVKEEHTPLNVTRSFAETFRVEYWEKYIKHMWQPVEAGVDPANPTLREMQGKIVILQDFDRDNQKYGMAYSSFDYQDHYNLENDGELYDKWLKVDRHLAAANSGPRETKYINYLSASNRAGRVFPYFVVSGHSDSRTSAPNKATGRTSPGFPRPGHLAAEPPGPSGVAASPATREPG